MRGTRRATALALALVALFAVALAPSAGSKGQAGAASAQLWGDLSAQSAATALAGKKVDVAAIRGTTRKLTLQRSGLQALLHGAPLERTAAAKSAPLVVSLPAPSGGFQRFALQQSPVMAPALARKHPEIQTYSGKGLDDPTATIRADLSPLGFHASIRSQHGVWYIDPANHRDQGVYASYYGSDLKDVHGLFQFKDAEAVHDDDSGAARSDAVSPDLSSGTVLRTYRLALVSDPSYATYWGASNVTAGKVLLMNRVDQIYEDEMSIRMVLIGNNDLLNLNTQAQAIAPNGPCGTAACYTAAQLASCGSSTLSRNRIVVGQIIGASNYDIGHIGVGQNGGGIASLGVVGGNSKAQGCTGIPQPDGDYYAVDYVAHEMGHQFAGNHTFNGTLLNCSGGNRNNATSVEPGSGSSIMAYAGICQQDDLQPHSDPYFSQRSHQETQTYVTSSLNNINEVQTISLQHYGGGNEIQQVTFGPGFSTTTSSFQVSIGGQDSATIGAGGVAYSNANIQTAINAISGFAGTVTVTGAAASGFTATFSGASAGANVPNMGLDHVDCGGCFSSVDETNHGGASDSFTLTYGGNTSVVFTNGGNYSAANLTAALQGTSEVQAVALTGYSADGASYTLNYNGADSVPITRGQNNTTAGIAAALAGGNEQQQVVLGSFNGTTQSFQIQYGGNTSVVLGAGGLAINNTNVAAAINGIAGFPGTVTAAGSGNAGFTATFAGASAQTDVSSLSIVGCTAPCTSSVRENVKGTTGVAGWIAGTTVSVGGLSDAGYTVTFNALGDVNPLAVTNGSAGVSGTVSTTTGGVAGILPAGATGTVAAFGGSGTLSNTGFQVTFGGTLAGSASVDNLTLTNRSAGLTYIGGETAHGGPVQNQGWQITPTGNHSPVVTAPASYTIPYRTPFTLTGSATDEDSGDVLTYMWEQNDIGSGTALTNNTKPTGPLFRQFGTRLDMSVYDVHASPSPGENATTTDPSRTFPDMVQILANNTNANSGTCPAPPSDVTIHESDAIADCYSEFLPTSVYAGPMHFRLTARDGASGGGGVNSADTTVNLAPGTGPFLVTSPNTAISTTKGTSQTVTWNVAGTDVAPISAANVDILYSGDGGSSWSTLLAGTPNDGSADVTLPNTATTHARIQVHASDNVFFDVSDSDFFVKSNQTISFGAIPNHTFGDADFTVSATASSGLDVSFTAAGTCTVTGNSVHLTGAGSCTVTAHQAGDDLNNAAPDVARTFAIAKGHQSITFPAISKKTLGTPDFEAGASASSGLPVTLTATGPCTIVDGHLIHLVDTGTCKVTASQPGDANWNAAAPVTQKFKVTAAPVTATTTTLTGPSQVPPGSSITVTATVGSSTGAPTSGSVQFFSGSTLLGEVSLSGGSASLTFDAPSSNTTLKIKASYVPVDGNGWKASNSAKLTIKVKP